MSTKPALKPTTPQKPTRQKWGHFKKLRDLVSTLVSSVATRALKNSVVARLVRPAWKRWKQTNVVITKVLGWYTALYRLTIFLGFFLLLPLALINYLLSGYDDAGPTFFHPFSYEKRDVQRCTAIADGPNQFGDRYIKVRYLSQGWLPADSMRFYNKTMGSDLVPYDFFVSLELPETGKLFRSDENLSYYGFLLQKESLSNPDGLPVGFVKNNYLGKDYVGFTCAACHTCLVKYNGTAIRIDGGSAGSDMDSFLQMLAEAMRVTQEDAVVRARFVKRVLGRGNYPSEDAINKDLKNFSLQVTMDGMVNRSAVQSGYYRLDAYGRIYNRVLEHIVTQDQLNEVMEDLVWQGKLTQAKLDELRQDKKTSILTGEQRDHLVFRLSQALPLKTQLELRTKLFNTPDAPVSYPFLWDAPYLDYVQWNGMASYAGPDSINRDIGEVVGAFATVDWAEERKRAADKRSEGIHASFRSSINVHNLRLFDRQLERLQSPQWPEDILPPIDKVRSNKGKELFTQSCVQCHAMIDRSDPERRIVTQMINIKNVQTDPKMAVNAVKYYGLSGILRNQLVSYGDNFLRIQDRFPVTVLLTRATLGVANAPDPNKGIIRRGLDSMNESLISFLSNSIGVKQSSKQGKFDADTPANPYASLLSYKARPLNGIWATAPYLHNGSVPTLYDLLLPPNPEDAKNPSAGVECRPVPAGVEYRPCKFMVGSREFDPERVGLKSAGYEGFVFNTKLPGNSNAGHEYGTKVLSKEDRLDLLEYLKTL